MKKTLTTRQMQIKLTQNQLDQLNELAHEYHKEYGIPKNKSALVKYLLNAANKDFKKKQRIRTHEHVSDASVKSM